MNRIGKERSKLITRSRVISAGMLPLMMAGSVAPGFCQGRSMAESNSPLARFLADTEPFSHKSLLEAIGKFSQKGSGELIAFNAQHAPVGTCILRHTDVDAKVSGYLARVTVTQKFHNSNREKIEALYTFPLPENAAVDDMTMKIGDRIIKGTIEEKSKAKEIYQEAARQGFTAALLDQERPNIFTQSVANVDPDADVDVVISYTQILPFENGSYAFIFPTVVGERFAPGNSRTVGENLNPPIATRSGHDISMRVAIDGGVPISNVASWLHEVDVASLTGSSSVVTLKQKNDIPNRDFVLTWSASAKSVSSGYLTHKTGDNGYLTMMLMPPKKVTREEIAPREMIFIMDCSGSMSGEPIEKSKETMHYVLDQLGPQDSFQIITFNNQCTELFTKPQPVSPSIKAMAHKFISGLQANGGTYMVEPIKKACSIPADKNRLRLVTFMTDGYVGNDMEVISLVQSLRKTSRWFPFGVGNSVNSFLINTIATQGGGESDTVLLSESGAAAAEKFYSRISSPVLTDVKVRFEGIDVKDVYPGAISDVWAQKPLYFEGRYKNPGKGKVILSAMQGGKPYSQVMEVSLPAQDGNNACIAQQWAHARVDELMSRDWMGVQNGHPQAAIKKEIVDTAIAHHIMTQFTSFVAVDRSHKTSEEPAMKVDVPVEPVQSSARANSQSSQMFSMPDRTAAANGPASSVMDYLVSSTRDANLFSGDAMDSAGSSSGYYSGAQTLQGATSGTVGPQGYDATVISGVSTSGTVRVNNLANLEALLNQLASIGDWLIYGIGAWLLGRGAFIAKNRVRHLVWGTMWVAACFIVPVVPVLLTPVILSVITLKFVYQGLKAAFDRQKSAHTNRLLETADISGSRPAAAVGEADETETAKV